MNAEVVKFSGANGDKMETEWMNFFNNFEWKSGMQYLYLWKNSIGVFEFRIYVWKVLSQL